MDRRSYLSVQGDGRDRRKESGTEESAGTFLFLKRKGDILILYQDIATGIENATISDTETEICREGHQLLVSGKDVRKIKLYHAGGNLLRQASATDGKQSVSLYRVSDKAFICCGNRYAKQDI